MERAFNSGPTLLPALGTLIWDYRLGYYGCWILRMLDYTDRKILHNKNFDSPLNKYNINSFDWKGRSGEWPVADSLFLKLLITHNSRLISRKDQ